MDLLWSHKIPDFLYASFSTFLQRWLTGKHTHSTLKGAMHIVYINYRLEM